MEKVKFLKRPKLNHPYLIIAWPGMGEVAFKAAHFLVDKLKAQEFANIRSRDFFYLTASQIEKGILNLPELPYSKFYYWKNPLTKTTSRFLKNDLIIFLSNAQPDLSKYDEYCQCIFSVIKYFPIKMVICFAAMPLPIDHTQEPAVWACATDNKLKELLSKYNLKLMSEGQISGMNGLFLGMAKKKGLTGFCLLGEIPIYTIQIENPKASYAVLEALNKILNLSIDIRELKDQADFVESQINQLVDYLKLGTQQLPPIGEEEIEGIKKSLSQYTKLPDSVKTNIESLFEQARKDISKANILKQELDKWNVYKDYEDRFLDLFKKPKEKGN
jgi:hypothetical protein